MKTVLIGGVFLTIGALALLKRQETDNLATETVYPWNAGDFLEDAVSYVQYNIGPAVGAGVSTDQDTMARTLYGEARGLGRAGMENVASVIMNRWKQRQAGKGYASWGPKGATVAQICQAPYQFSCWNNGDPNQALCRQVTPSDPAFAVALDVAGDAIAGALVDRTGGADHYFATSMASLPKWADATLETLKDAGHRFLKLVS